MRYPGFEEPGEGEGLGDEYAEVSVWMRMLLRLYFLPSDGRILIIS